MNDDALEVTLKDTLGESLRGNSREALGNTPGRLELESEEVRLEFCLSDRATRWERH